jgi:hypothetical protein
MDPRRQAGRWAHARAASSWISQAASESVCPVTCAESSWLARVCARWSSSTRRAARRPGRASWAPRRTWRSWRGASRRDLPARPSFHPAGSDKCSSILLHPGMPAPLCTSCCLPESATHCNAYRGGSGRAGWKRRPRGGRRSARRRRSGAPRRRPRWCGGRAAWRSSARPWAGARARGRFLRSRVCLLPGLCSSCLMAAPSDCAPNFENAFDQQSQIEGRARLAGSHGAWPNPPNSQPAGTRKSWRSGRRRPRRRRRMRRRWPPTSARTRPACASCPWRSSGARRAPGRAACVLRRCCASGSGISKRMRACTGGLPASRRAAVAVATSRPAEEVANAARLSRDCQAKWRLCRPG